VPTYPGSTPAGTFSGSTEEGQAGAFNFKTSHAVTEVMSFYKDKLKAAGFETNTSQWDKDGSVAGGSVSGKKGKTTVALTVVRESDETIGNVVYRTEK
jgi:hypothetical protein